MTVQEIVKNREIVTLIGCDAQKHPIGKRILQANASLSFALLILPSTQLLNLAFGPELNRTLIALLP